MHIADEIIDLLVAFGGGKGGEPGNVIVRFLLPTFFWAILAFVSFREWKRGRETRDRYIGIASLMGMGRELLMFVAEYGSFKGLVSFSSIYRFYPPVEHTATMLAYVFTGAAFINYRIGRQRFSRYLFASATAVAFLLYSLTALLWPHFLNIHPGAAFGSFWGDMAFRMCASVFLGLVLSVLLYEHTGGGKTQKTLMTGFLFWFLDELLMIVNLATQEQHIGIFAPVRHNLHIWAIPMLLGVYWSDLTDRLSAALQDVQQEKAKAESIIAGIGDGLTIQDRHFRIIYQNQIHKESSGDHVGEYCYKAYAGKEALCGDCTVALSFQDGCIHRSERVAETRSGPRQLEITASPLKDPTGRIIAGIELVRDVTERKRAEASLEKSKAFNRRILEAVDEGFVVIDRDYKILSANKSYLAQVKAPLEAVLGKHCHLISHRIDKPCFESGEDCAVRRTFETGDPASAVHTHYDSAGGRVSVEIKSYPLKDESGNVVSAIEVIKDITETRKLEDQLRHAQKMEAVGHLAGGVAHDFNNILTAIVGFGSLMKMEMAKDDTQTYRLEQILDSADRATKLTQGLLAFSRKQVINPKPVNLNDIVINIEKLIRRLLGEELELRLILAERDLTIKADSGQLGQVLMNLATNARDAMPDRGTLSITTELAALDLAFINSHGYGRPGTYALLSVADTGVGMDGRTKKNIFEPFFTTKEVGKGTGLGLSIVYGIVKQHNGYIVCDSKPSSGSLFRIYLPMIRSVVETAVSETMLPIQGGAETVLVAEDDGAVRRFMKEILHQYGYTVIEAMDGEEAVGKFLENRDRVQLVILDVMMPKKNGKEVFDDIHAIRPEVKVIFASGYAGDVLHKKGLFNDGHAFIHKPVSPAELMKKVRAVLDGAQEPMG